MRVGIRYDHSNLLSYCGLSVRWTCHPSDISAMKRVCKRIGASCNSSGVCQPIWYDDARLDTHPLIRQFEARSGSKNSPVGPFAPDCITF